MKNNRCFFGAGAAFLLVLALGVGTTAGASPEGLANDQQASLVSVMPNDSAPKSSQEAEHVVLAHPISLPEASEIGAGIPEVVGFRIEQPGLVGEVFPGEKYTVEQYLSDFERDYGVQPAVTEVILESSESQSETQDLTTDEVNADALEGEFDKAKAVTPEAPSEHGAMATAARDTKSDQPPAVDARAAEAVWAPQFTQIWAQNIDGQAAVAQLHRWYAERKPSNMPSDWGMENDLMQHTSHKTAGTRPACLPTNFRELFWSSKAGNIAWDFYDPQGGSLSGVGAYFDWDDLTDGCGEQSITVGIGYPQNLPAGDSGVTELMTRVVGEVGVESSTKFSAYAQAVSNDCNDLGQEPGSACMGLNTERSFPASGGQQSQIVVNRNREWTLPGCFATEYPNSPITVPDCGFLE